MKKKRILTLIIALCLCFALASCNEATTTTKTANNATTENEGLQRMFSPVVSISKSGLATWSDIDNASEYIYVINDNEEVRTDKRSVQLSLGDTIKVKALGNNVTRRDSRWSAEATFIAPHSYLTDNSGVESTSLNIYKPDGTIVLDTINGTKTAGDVLKTGEEYIFEFDITVGPYHNGLLLAGIDNSVISDLTWSDSMYVNREGENADTSDYFYEVQWNSLRSLYPDYPGIHRLDWGYQGQYWGSPTYGWKLSSQPLKNTNGVYDTREEGYFSVEPNWCSSLYGAHIIGSGKSSSTQMDAGYKYVRFKIVYDEFRMLSTGQVDSVEEFGALLGRERFNMFAIVHCNYSYIYFDSNNQREEGNRDYSIILDDNGNVSDGITIYDALTKEVVLGNGSKGQTLDAGKEYIIEIETTGSDVGKVMLAGLDNCLIGDACWSNSIYTEDDLSSVISDTLGVVGLDTQNHHLASDNPLYHVMWKSSNGYTSNYLRDCAMVNGVINTSLSSNKNTDFNCCMTFARKTWLSSKKTTAEAKATYFRFSVVFNEFSKIEVGGVVTDKESSEYGTLAAINFNMFVYSPAGGRYLYLVQ